MREGGKERVVPYGRRNRLIPRHELLTLQRAAIVNKKGLMSEQGDHGGWPIGDVNPGVDRVIKEFAD